MSLDGALGVGFDIDRWGEAEARERQRHIWMFRSGNKVRCSISRRATRALSSCTNREEDNLMESVWGGAVHSGTAVRNGVKCIKLRGTTLSMVSIDWLSSSCTPCERSPPTSDSTRRIFTCFSHRRAARAASLSSRASSSRATAAEKAEPSVAPYKQGTNQERQKS